MKHTLTSSLLCILLTSTVDAKNETSRPVANATVQFIENRGQITDQHGAVRQDIDAKVEANGVVLFVGDGEIHYQWTKSRESGAGRHPPSPFGDTPFEGRINEAEGKRDVEIYRMDVRLVGANKNAAVIFEEPTGYYENYYLAHMGENGVRAKGYGRIIYKDIYQNIDLILYTEQNSKVKSQNLKENNLQSNIEYQTSNIKYDFIVHPGGNPADIQLRYEGATDIKLVEGVLIATTPFGTITEAAPYSYNAETKEEVQSVFKLSGNTLSFGVGNYSGTLVIDPILEWATYYGHGTNEGIAASQDNKGNVFLTGNSSGTYTTNIATSGAFQTTRIGEEDIFLVKFNSAGVRQWGTFFGGTKSDFAIAITVHGNGIYIAGWTNSDTGFSTQGSFQSVYGGGKYDGLITQFDTSGQRIWTSYLGGNATDNISDVQVDKAGNVYVCGLTNSNNNISTQNSHQDILGGGYAANQSWTSDTFDAFIVKFSQNMNRLWGTYYGGNNNDGFVGLRLDDKGYIYAVGFSASTIGMATSNTFQPTFGGAAFVSGWGSNINYGDGLVVKFDVNGARIWGTYYGGGASVDIVSGITLDASNNIYICGTTVSSSGIASTGAFKTNYTTSSQGDGFIAKLDTAGSRLWGTYYGTNGPDRMMGICASPDGQVYVTGWTGSTTGIATTGAYQTSLNNLYDFFLASFNTNGGRVWGTYYGGNNEEWPGYGTGWNHSGNKSIFKGTILITGETLSNAGIATTGAHQTTSTSATALLAKFIVDTVVNITVPFYDSVFCPGDTFLLPYHTNLPFYSGNIFTVQLSDSTGAFSSPVNIGAMTDTFTDTIVCIIPVNTLAGSRYRIRIVADSPARTSWDNGLDIRIKAHPDSFAVVSNSPVCTGDTLHLTGSSTSTGITWAWTGPNSFGSSSKDSFIANAQLIDSGKYILKTTLNSTGCSLTDTTTVEMRLTPAKPTTGSNSPVCETLPLTLTSSSGTTGVGYSWAGPGSYSSNTQNPTVTTSAGSTHAGDYISTATLNGCSNRDTTTVVVLPKPAKPTAGATNSPLCARQDLQLTASTITGASYAWYGPSAFTANVQNPVRANIQMGDAGKHFVYAIVSGCVSDTDSVAVVVNTDPFVNIFPTPGASICQWQQAIFTAVPTNGGTTSYNWLVNGIPTGGTGTTYNTTTLNNGDAVSCAMTSTGTCATPFIDTSNAITMTVQPILSPTVTMTADKMPPWNGGLTVTFTATPTHGGATPEYQWKRNGADVVGATGSSWGVIVNALNTNEDICVVLKSSYECAVPDTAMSNCITTAFTGIVGEATNNGGFKIYPNPVRNILHVEAPLYLSPKGRGLNNAGEVTVEMVDVLGRKCATASTYLPPQAERHSVNVSSLVPGVYVVRVNGVVVGRVVKE